MEGQRFFEFIYYLVTLDSNYFNFQLSYLQFIFPVVFWLTLIISLVVCSLYYNLINNFTAKLGYFIYWFLFMILAGGIAFYLAVSKVADSLYIGLSLGSDAWIFAANNFVIACILFFIFSLILKTRKISTYADHVPFKTPW